MDFLAPMVTLSSRLVFRHNFLYCIFKIRTIYAWVLSIGSSTRVWGFGSGYGNDLGQRRPVPDVCRILCDNVPGLSGNINGLTVPSSLYDILLCSEILVTEIIHVSELLVLGFGRPPCLVVPGHNTVNKWLQPCERDMEQFTSPNLEWVLWNAFR